MRDNFNDLLWFLVVAEERSFTRTAAKIGITQSTLSHTIKRLETRMGFDSWLVRHEASPRRRPVNGCASRWRRVSPRSKPISRL